MPSYRFTAVDVRGERMAGLRSASTPQSLADQLDEEGWTVLEMELAVESAPTPGDLSGSGALSETEARELAEHLADLTAAGLPLSDGLRALAEELPAGRLRRFLPVLADRLEHGATLEEVLKEQQRRFPAHLGALLLASVRSGRVGIVLGDFVTYARLGRSLRAAVWLSLAYPFFVFLAFSALTVFICLFVVRGFASIFADFGINIPIMTQLLLNFAEVVSERGWQVFLTPIVVVGLSWLAARLLLDPYSRRWLLCRIPLFGPLWRWAALAEFCHYLGLLIDCELPLTRAVVLAGQATGDAELLRDCETMSAVLHLGGVSLVDASRGTEALPGAFRKLLVWAQGRRSISDALHLIGDVYDAQARTRAAFVTTVISFILIIIVLWGAGFLVTALFLPLIQLLGRLSG